MKTKNIQHSVGTLCFLPDENIEMVLSNIEKLRLNLNKHWRILIVTSTAQSSENGFAKINRRSKHWPVFDHLIVKEGLENQVVCPTVIKILNALQFVKTRYISFVDGQHLPQIKNLTSLKKILDHQIDLGAVRGSIKPIDLQKKDDSAYMFETEFFEPGKGINQFGLSGLSPIGVLYNVPFLYKSKIFESLQKNAQIYVDAPRVSFYSSSFTYLNILVAAKGKTGLSSQAVYEEIKIEKSIPNKVSKYFSWRSFGQRCDQVIAIRNTLFEGYTRRNVNKEEQTLESDLFYASYIKLCSQLLTLIVDSTKDSFFDQMMGIELITRSYVMFCVGALQEFPNFKKFEADINRCLLAKAEALLRKSESRQFLSIEKNTNYGLPSFYSN